MNTRITITSMRKAGWKAENVGAGKGFSYWKLTAPNGAQFEVDLGENRRWIVESCSDREGWDADTLWSALESVFYSSCATAKVAA